ncbi:hypothetical protein [Frankia sp. QA3]|uniref:hypothetical protein n=1 Tax=Frankia sp. QA3 TaxID=710111 RepID=UPI0002D4AF44|nr:hypothetical protein [Frankia sp. QA3]
MPAWWRAGGEGVALTRSSHALLGFVTALWLQFRSRRHQAPVYWFAVVMLAVFGTLAADGPPRGHVGSTVF